MIGLLLSTTALAQTYSINSFPSSYSNVATNLLDIQDTRTNPTPRLLQGELLRLEIDCSGLVNPATGKHYPILGRKFIKYVKNNNGKTVVGTRSNTKSYLLAMSINGISAKKQRRRTRCASYHSSE